MLLMLLTVFWSYITGLPCGYYSLTCSPMFHRAFDFSLSSSFFTFIISRFGAILTGYLGLRDALWTIWVVLDSTTALKTFLNLIFSKEELYLRKGSPLNVVYKLLISHVISPLIPPVLLGVYQIWWGHDVNKQIGQNSAAFRHRFCAQIQGHECACLEANKIKEFHSFSYAHLELEENLYQLCTAFLLVTSALSQA